jgi:hypothetical protein
MRRMEELHLAPALASSRMLRDMSGPQGIETIYRKHNTCKAQYRAVPPQYGFLMNRLGVVTEWCKAMNWQ